MLHVFHSAILSIGLTFFGGGQASVTGLYGRAQVLSGNPSRHVSGQGKPTVAVL